MKTLAGIVFAASVLVGGVAHAGGYGYICNLTELPSSSWGHGNAGGVQLNVYANPQCTGAYVGGGVFCTTGAVAGQCSTAYGLRDEAQQVGFIERLEHAMNNNQHIYLYTDSSGNVSNVLFYSQGW